MAITCSGMLNADKSITKKDALLFGAILYAAAADANLIIYNGEDASGGVSARMHYIAIDVSIEGNTSTKPCFFPEPVRCRDGIYADITGAGAYYIVYYKPLAGTGA